MVGDALEHTNKLPQNHQRSVSVRRQVDFATLSGALGSHAGAPTEIRQGS